MIKGLTKETQTELFNRLGEYFLEEPQLTPAEFTIGKMQFKVNWIREAENFWQAVLNNMPTLFNKKEKALLVQHLQDLVDVADVPPFEMFSFAGMRVYSNEQFEFLYRKFTGKKNNKQIREFKPRSNSPYRGGKDSPDVPLDLTLRLYGTPEKAYASLYRQKQWVEGDERHFKSWSTDQEYQLRLLMGELTSQDREVKRLLREIVVVGSKKKTYGYATGARKRTKAYKKFMEEVDAHNDHINRIVALLDQKLMAAKQDFHDRALAGKGSKKFKRR